MDVPPSIEPMSTLAATGVLASATTVVLLSLLSLYYMIHVGHTTKCLHAWPLLTVSFLLVVAEAIQAALILIGPFIHDPTTLKRLWLLPNVMHLLLLPLLFPSLAGYLALLSSTITPRACLCLDVLVPRRRRTLKAFTVVGCLLSTTTLTALGLSVPIINTSLTRPVVMLEAKPGMVYVTLLRLLPIILSAMYLVVACLLISFIWLRLAVGVAAILCFFSNFIGTPVGIYIVSPYFELLVLVALVREIAFLYWETKSPTASKGRNRGPFKEVVQTGESSTDSSSGDSGAGTVVSGSSPPKPPGYGSFNPYQRLTDGPISPGLVDGDE